MFLPDNETMKYVRLLTREPSDENIKATIKDLRSLLLDDGSVDSEIELIAGAVEPTHHGITNRLRNKINS